MTKLEKLIGAFVLRRCLHTSDDSFQQELYDLISAAKAEQREEIALSIEARADELIKQGTIVYAQLLYDISGFVREDKNDNI